MRNSPPPLFKTPRRRRKWDNIQRSESIKAPRKQIRGNPGRRQRKITTDNSGTQISEISPSNVEKKNNSKDQTVVEKALCELESIHMEDEVKNISVTESNLVINSGEVKAMVRHLWKVVELREQHYNKIQRQSNN
jgi:hypothetical protein